MTMSELLKRQLDQRLSFVRADEWLDPSEVVVLDPLEDSPLPLGELRWHEATTLPQPQRR